MKKTLVFLSFLLTMSFANVYGFAVTAPVNPVDPATLQASGLSAILTQNLTVEEFLALTPSTFAEKTGNKLTFKETIALKKAQKKIKKAMENPDTNNAGGPKKQLVAFLLCWFFGVLGIHRFYLGYVGIGIIQLLTGGGCGIWVLIDFIRIITGDMRAKDGSEMEPW